jgi:NitT/TauT family transport system substrate-binding protein
MIKSKFSLFGMGLALCAAFTVGVAGPVHAQTKVRMGVTPIGDYITAYVAKDRGIFAKHGLDVTLQTVAISPMAAAGLMSGSLDLATPTAVDLIQAVDSGLDLVAVSSVGVLAKTTGTRSGVLVRPDVEIKQPADYAGKKIAQASLGGMLHVLFRNYLLENGVDPGKVNDVEIGVPSHFDALKGRSVDAVVTADPMLSRILATRTGTQAISLANTVPADTVTGLVASTRAYAQKNPAVLTAFRAAWKEATALVIADHAMTRSAIVQHLKLPEPVAASLTMPLSVTTDVTPKQLQWWVEVMRKQNMLRGKVDPQNLIAR